MAIRKSWMRNTIKCSTLPGALAMLLSLAGSNSWANTPLLADAERLFNFAEVSEPTLFFPPAQTQQANQAGSDWFYRFFSETNSYAAVNINGTAPYKAGDVYVSGTQFGEGLLRVGTLQELLAVVDAAAPTSEPAAPVQNAFISQGNGTCTDRKFPAQNDTATFRITTFTGNTSALTSRTEFYEAVSDSQTITVIEQSVLVDGTQVVTSNRLTAYYQSNNGMFYNSGSDSVISTKIAGATTVSQDSNLAYSPALFVGPSDQLCVGQEWTAAPVTQTQTTDPDPSGTGPIVSQTTPTTTRVDAIGDQVNVSGGSFSTIKRTLIYPEGRTIIWTDIQFGVKVMSETYLGNAETPSIVEELTSFDLPF